MESLKRICLLFEQRLGYNTHYLADSLWERAIKERMKELLYEDEKLYYNYLATNEAEFQHLTEKIVVIETWFFRDSAAYDYLVEWLKTFLNKGNTRMVRILSVPCSTGEEPYSIAIALQDAGIPSSQYLIEGVDISRELIERGLKGVYSKNSFRNLKEKYFKNYFVKKGENYSIITDVRSQVFLRHGNAMLESTYPQNVAYDAIFCRNLMIYLDTASQKKLFAILAKKLKPEGRLFVAPSELEAARINGFQAMGTPQACALRYNYDETPTPVKQSQHLSAKEAEAILMSFSIPLNRRKSMNRMKEAMALADNGSFKKAEILCQEHLKENKDDPEAFYLLGLICQACSDFPKAEEYFTKTLYLAPEHYEALIHMSLIMERHGDHDRASVFKKRAQRQHNKSV
ncbi:MAG: CheR family methyltransferase [Parachlamydiales bacterium]|jgi:chemotaxis protein methyltransferase WspC